MNLNYFIQSRVIVEKRINENQVS